MALKKDMISNIKKKIKKNKSVLKHVDMCPFLPLITRKLFIHAAVTAKKVMRIVDYL